MTSPFILFLITLSVGFAAGERGWYLITVPCFVLSGLSAALFLSVCYAPRQTCQPDTF